jgi:hypothetical protein
VTQVCRLRLHGFIAWLIARGYHLAWVPTLNHKVRILADWAISMFFHADAIPLTALEHPEQELMRHRTSSSPRGTSDAARGPGHRPAHRGEPADDDRPASPAAPRPAPRCPQPHDLGPPVALP